MQKCLHQVWSAEISAKNGLVWEAQDCGPYFLGVYIALWAVRIAIIQHNTQKVKGFGCSKSRISLCLTLVSIPNLHVLL